MKMSKGLIIGQVVFLAALGGVLFTQLKGGKHPPAPAAVPAQHEESKGDGGAKTAAHEGEEKGHREPEGHGEAKAHGESKGHAARAEEKGHPKKEHDGDPANSARDLGTDPKAIARELLAGNGRFA